MASSAQPSPVFLFDNDPCGTSYLEYWLIQYVFFPSVYFSFGIIMIVEQCKLAHVAVVAKRKSTKSLILKYFLTVLFMISLFLDFIMAFVEGEYWINICGGTPWIGALNIFQFLSCILYMRWTNYQYKRRIPLLWQHNQLFWGISVATYAILIILCYIIGDGGSSADLGFNVIKLFFSSVLLIHTIRNPQDRAEFTLSEEGNDAPLIADISRQEDPHRSTSQIFFKKLEHDRTYSDKSRVGTALLDEKASYPLTVTVSNKAQQKVDTSGQTQTVYKLHVQVGTRDYKVSRTIDEFKKLENALISSDAKMFKNITFDTISSAFADPDSDSISNVVKNVIILQNFLNGVGALNDSVPPQFLAFLQIPEPEKSKMLVWNRQNNVDVSMARTGSDFTNTSRIDSKSLMTDLNETQQNSSYLSDMEYALSGEEMTEEQLKMQMHSKEEDYCVYFNVSISKYRKAQNSSHFEYIINLQLVERPDEKWTIYKRYSDFILLNKQIQLEKKINPPQLPKKLMVNDESSLHERQIALETFLRIILNEKIFFIPSVFEFIELKEVYYEWIKEDEEWDFTRYKAEIDRNQIILNNKKPYTVYHVIIKELNPIGIKGFKSSQEIWRRYKEFDQLSKALINRFASSGKKLPELPPKYNRFSNKTTVDFRQRGLEEYLNELFKYSNIGDSFEFRRFINLKRKMGSFVEPSGFDMTGSKNIGKDITGGEIDEKIRIGSLSKV